MRYLKHLNPKLLVRILSGERPLEKKTISLFALALTTLSVCYVRGLVLSLSLFEAYVVAGVTTTSEYDATFALPNNDVCEKNALLLKAYEGKNDGTNANLASRANDQTRRKSARARVFLFSHEEERVALLVYLRQRENRESVRGHFPGKDAEKENDG